MSSTLDAGYYASQAMEMKDTECSKSPTKQHSWVHHGTCPSTWSECKYCGLHLYSK